MNILQGVSCLLNKLYYICNVIRQRLTHIKMEYTEEQINQAFKLLRATQGILRKCDKGPYVKNVFEQTAIWDDTECDGYCLREEIDELIQDIED